MSEKNDTMYNEITNLPDTKEVLKVFNSNVKRDTNLVIAISDVKAFQLIKNQYGKKASDDILSNIAYMIKNYFPKSDFIGHYENDQFYMLFKTDDINKIATTFNDINKKLKKGVITFSDDVINCELSVGLSLFEYKIDDFLEVLTNTQHAYKKARNSGRVVIFKKGKFYQFD